MDERFATTAPFQQLMMREAEALVTGENRFLIVNIPPRFTKTQIFSVLFPIYALGHFPRAEVVLASHNSDLAEKNSRDARNLLEQDAWPFPVRLARDSTAATRWNLETGGSVRALGVGSALLGRGADFMIIDDPINDGSSVSECKSAVEWFQEIAASRLNKNAKIVVVHQRLSTNDLTACILESEIGPDFRVINLTAICDSADDLLGRQIGEPLWPTQFSLEELEVRRKMMGTRAFEAQYYGRVSPIGGALFKREWFDNRYGAIPEKSPAPTFTPDPVQSIFEPAPYISRRTVKVQGIDTASKTGVHNDYSVITTVASDYVDTYVMDVRRERVEFAQLVRMVLDEYWKHKPDFVYIEDSSAGVAVVQELRRQTALPIVPITAKGSKESRAEAITALFEAKRVRLPERAAWVPEFIDEFLAFPGGRHDDQVDATVLAVTQVRDVCEWRESQSEMQKRLRHWNVRN